MGARFFSDLNGCREDYGEDGVIERPLKGRVTVEARDAAPLFFVVTCFVLAYVLALAIIARFDLSVTTCIFRCEQYHRQQRIHALLPRYQYSLYGFYHWFTK